MTDHPLSDIKAKYEYTHVNVEKTSVKPADLPIAEPVPTGKFVLPI